MANHKGQEDWTKLQLMLIFVFVNSRNITIQGIYKSIKFEKCTYGVRALIGQSISGTGLKTFLDTV